MKETILSTEKLNISYSKGQAKPTVSEMDFEIKRGEIVGIVGESGSGKSTVLKLLLGLLPGYGGSIRYNESEQKQTELSSLYEQVAYVDQQVYLFQDSLRFNITLGADYSDEEVMAAVKACKLEDLVESLPCGLDSLIEENGKNL